MSNTITVLRKWNLYWKVLLRQSVLLTNSDSKADSKRRREKEDGDILITIHSQKNVSYSLIYSPKLFLLYGFSNHYILDIRFYFGIPKIMIPNFVCVVYGINLDVKLNSVFCTAKNNFLIQYVKRKDKWSTDIK